MKGDNKMLNLTLTITAAPELLAAISTFTNAVTAAKVVTIPQNNSDFNSSKDKIAATYQQQNTVVQQAIPSQASIPNQLPAQAQVPTNVMNLYNQPSNVPTYQIQSPEQAAVQTIPTQGATVPTTVQTYTMEQLAVAATQIVDAGRRTELVGLLSSFGVQALTALPKEQYGAFATQLRALGAKI